MKSVLLPLSLLASFATSVSAAEELKIDTTLSVECERKTQKGDTIHVHYRGTLQSNGEKFDASQSTTQPSAGSSPWHGHCYLSNGQANNPYLS